MRAAIASSRSTQQASRPPPACLLASGLAIALLTLSALYSSLWLWPEIGMISNSQCKNPLQSWNGKLLNYQVWRSGFEGRPPTHNIHFRGANLSEDRRKLLERVDRRGETRSTMAQQGDHNGTGTRIILWGAHHKTGTYLAQKIFSVICARMRWCCIFHPTRDSIDAIHDTFANEPVSVIGHNQWIWYPKEIASSRPYKFVHFYRHPVKKVVSGYRYHRDGAEAWTSALKPYSQVCRSNLLRQSHEDLKTPNNSSLFLSKSLSSHASRYVSRLDVVDHCKAVHLCITCCRREHERLSGDIRPRLADTKHRQRQRQIGRDYFLRPVLEYDYLCRHLGEVDSHGASLKESLLSSPEHEGLAIEAALAFYENLRMARILNHTWSDPHSLNLDIDAFASDFRGNMWALLQHLDLGLSYASLANLAAELDFYNTKHSLLYRWSMSSSLNNHLDTSGSERASHSAAELGAQEDFRAVYAEIFQLMSKAL